MNYDEFEKRVTTAWRFREVAHLLGLSASEIARRLNKSKGWASLFMRGGVTCVQPKTYEAMRAALVDLELELRTLKNKVSNLVKKINSEVSK
jgi:transcriptional regulator with XRE-family HTH domain